MPCYTVQYTQIDVSKMHPATLRRALEIMGYDVQETAQGLSFRSLNISGLYREGQLTVPRAFDLPQLQRIYSRENTKRNAKRYGWRVIERQDGKIELKRRA